MVRDPNVCVYAEAGDRSAAAGGGDAGLFLVDDINGPSDKTMHTPGDATQCDIAFVIFQVDPVEGNGMEMKNPVEGVPEALHEADSAAAGLAIGGGKTFLGIHVRSVDDRYSQQSEIAGFSTPPICRKPPPTPGCGDDRPADCR